jgi:hypothetical protein
MAPNENKIKKLQSFFLNKETFQMEIAKRRLTFNQEEQECFKGMYSEKLDIEECRKMEVLKCSQDFTLEVFRILNDLMLDLDTEIKVRKNNIDKSEFIEDEIKKMTTLIFQLHNLKHHYQVKDSVKAEEKFDNLLFQSQFAGINTEVKTYSDIQNLQRLLDLENNAKFSNFYVHAIPILKTISFEEIYGRCVTQIILQIDGLILGLISFEKDILEKYYLINEGLPYLISKVDKSLENPKKIKPETLRDIFEGTESEYQYIISFLKEPYMEIDSSFITSHGEKLIWNKTPTKGWSKYLAGFISALIKKKYIKDQHSANLYHAILCKTFNLTDFDKGNLKSVANFYESNPDYSRAFTSLPEKNSN